MHSGKGEDTRIIKGPNAFFDRTLLVSMRGCKLLRGGGILHLTWGLLSSVYSVRVKTLRLFVCYLTYVYITLEAVSTSTE